VKFLRQLSQGLSTIGELLQVLKEQKRWWLIPLVIILSFFGLLLLLGQGSPLGPLIYTLF
jgi:hypothetical protein